MNRKSQKAPTVLQKIFLCQQELLVGLGDEQFNVRERFDAIEKAVAEIPGTPGQPGPVSWNDVQNKPQKFPPQEHSHSVTDIGDFVQTIEEIVTNGETPDLSIYATKIYVDHKVAEIVAANQVALTLQEYNALSVKDPNMLYLIPEIA